MELEIRLWFFSEMALWPVFWNIDQYATLCCAYKGVYSHHTLYSIRFDILVCFAFVKVSNCSFFRVIDTDSEDN